MAILFSSSAPDDVQGDVGTAAAAAVEVPTRFHLLMDISSFIAVVVFDEVRFDFARKPRRVSSTR